MCAFSVFDFNGYSGVVCDVLACSGEHVEDSGFSAVWVAGEGDGDFVRSLWHQCSYKSVFDFGLNIGIFVISDKDFLCHTSAEHHFAFGNLDDERAWVAVIYDGNL